MTESAPPVIHLVATLTGHSLFSGGHVTIGSQNQTDAVQFEFQQFNPANGHPVFQEAITLQGQNLLSNLDFTGNGLLDVVENLDLTLPMPTLQSLWF